MDWYEFFDNEFKSFVLEHEVFEVDDDSYRKWWLKLLSYLNKNVSYKAMKNMANDWKEFTDEQAVVIANSMVEEERLSDFMLIMDYMSTK